MKSTNREAGSTYRRKNKIKRALRPVAVIAVFTFAPVAQIVWIKTIWAYIGLPESMTVMGFGDWVLALGRQVPLPYFHDIGISSGVLLLPGVLAVGFAVMIVPALLAGALLIQMLTWGEE